MKKRRDQSEIYEAALRCFAKYGYKKTTLDNIGDELGMTNVNLYGYAESKQALYRDSVVYALTKWQARVTESLADSGDDPVTLFKKLCESSILYLSNDRVFCEVLKNDSTIFQMFPTVDPYEDVHAKSYQLIVRVLEAGMEKGCFRDIDVTRVATMFFDIFKGMIIDTYIHENQHNLLEKTNRLIDILLYGLVGRD